MLEDSFEIFKWLQDLGLEEYATNFINEEMYKDTFDQLDQKTLKKTLKISPAGHRIKILKAIKCQISHSDDTPRIETGYLDDDESVFSDNRSSGSNDSWEIDYRALSFGRELGR